MFASTQIDELLALIGAKQDAAPVLTSLSGLAGHPDTMVYLTGATSLATCTLSGAARLLIACATAANWIEIARTSNGQTNALIVALTVVVVGSGTVAGIVPAGYFARLRTLTTAGAAAPTYTTAGQQEVKLG